MIRLGYACINMTLAGGFKTCRLDTFQQNGLVHVRKLTINNFLHTLNIIKWNIVHDIFLYRLSSEIIPFGGHPLLNHWLWWEDDELSNIATEVRSLVKKHNLRITIHPWQGNNLASPYKDVLIRTFEDLNYQTNLLNFFGGTDLILHIGGRHGSKFESIKRFKKHYQYLSDTTRSVLRIENDDKIYTIADVFSLCDDLNLNPVFDFHHDICAPSLSNSEIKHQLKRYWPGLRHKMHLSTGLSGRLDRSHADYISQSTWEEFEENFGEFEADVMLECKAKELAVLKVREYPTKVGAF